MPYDSPRRREQAAETRRRIVGAARRLFAARGFSVTTVAELAQEAGVASQTVYAVFGGKRGLIGALVDLIDEESDVPALASRAMRSTDPDEVLALAVRIPRSIVERSGDLIAALASAAAIDEVAAAALGSGGARHDRGFARIVGRLAELHALRPGVDPAEAAAVFATLTSDQTFRHLVERHAWDLDACEAWMRETLATLYLR